MRNGFIYTGLKFMINELCRLNLVEYFKKVGKWLNPQPNDPDMEKAYIRVATDIFIVLKWALLLILWITATSNNWWIVVTWYLIITNLYTYFFHHIWTDESLNTSNFSADRIRRRFLNLFVAFAYSEMAFAYLYQCAYKEHYKWTDGVVSSGHAIWFSISNSLAANYDVVKPNDDFSNSVSMVQLLITFIFITIIISRSIPQKS